MPELPPLGLNIDRCINVPFSNFPSNEYAFQKQFFVKLRIRLQSLLDYVYTYPFATLGFKRHRVQLRLNQNFTDALGKKGSPQFSRMEARIEKAVCSVYFTLFGIIVSEIERDYFSIQNQPKR